MRVRFPHIARFILSLLLMASFALTVRGEDAQRLYPLRYPVYGWDNVGFAVCYWYGNGVLDVRSVPYNAVGTVFQARVSPNRISFASIYLKEKEKTRAVSIFSRGNGKELFRFPVSGRPMALAYSANAKELFVSTDAGLIHVFSLSPRRLIRDISTLSPARTMVVSRNGYFVAVPNRDVLVVYNAETGAVRRILEPGANITQVTFSPDNTRMAVLCSDGQLRFYNTKTFGPLETIGGLGDAICCDFHPDGKYIAVATASDHIQIINMKRPDQRVDMDAPHAGITRLSFVRQMGGELLMCYNTDSEFVFVAPPGLVPDYEQLIADEVDGMMNEWMRMMPGESFSDYRLRVNDETRAARRAQLEGEVTTRLAGDRASGSFSLGGYDSESSSLELNFDNMPSIFLPVPEEDWSDFAGSDPLVFSNSIYTLGENDRFELVYTEVTNSRTGKTYVFDRRVKPTLEILEAEDDYVPMDFIELSTMEEVRLQEIREAVISEAREQNLISDHTHIDVRTRVESTYDAEGRSIMNYLVDFSYDVDEEFSAAEDFKPGRYDVGESASAMAMLRIVENAFREDLGRYFVPGRKVRVVLTGSADAIPIRRPIAYRSEYGEHEEMPVTLNGELSALNLHAAGGIATNEQLAFARALSVQHYAEQQLTDLAAMQTDYDYVISVSNERGAEFRRIGIQFVFIDAFNP